MTNISPLMQIENLMNQLSAEDLLTLAKSAQYRAQNKVKTELKLGDEVMFDARSRGIKVGILVKKNAKTFNVLVGSTTWKVSPTLLKKAA